MEYFTRHPKSVGMTYFEHAYFSCELGFFMGIGSVKAISKREAAKAKESVTGAVIGHGAVMDPAGDEQHMAETGRKITVKEKARRPGRRARALGAGSGWRACPWG